jgi:iron complex outermembrane receptor protein
VRQGVRQLLRVFAALLCAVTLASAQSSAELSGLIVDATGRPLPGVSVALHGTGDASYESDEAGMFAFAQLPAGRYNLVARRSGFAAVRRTVRLSPGQNTSVVIILNVEAAEHAVVTATKTGETEVQATPLAISVLSDDDFSRTGNRTIEHVARLAPSVTFSQNTGWAQISIRGIGTNVVNAGGDPSSAVYLDGVYLARPAMVLSEFLDLERAEVLRGPQGTLYGRNAVGGAINLITRPPTADFDLTGSIELGDDRMRRTKARISGPLIRGRIMGSASALMSVRPGFVHDLNHPDHPLGREDMLAGKGQIRVVLNRSAELLVSADTSHQTSTPLTYAKVLAVKPGFVVDNPFDLHEVRTSMRAESRNTQAGLLARFVVNLTPDLRLTSLAAYRKLDYEVLVDADITELNLTLSNPHETQHQLSEELTVSGRARNILWIGGLFLFEESDRQPTHVLFGEAQRDTLLNPDVKAETGAVFGQATVDLTPQVAVTAGIRYSDERKRIHNDGRTAALGAPAEVLEGSTYAYSDAIAHDAWMPKLAVELRATPNTMLYASVTRGFKTGGFNLTSRQPGRGFAPERASSYEGGLKSILRSGRARASVSGFLTDFSNLQVQTAIVSGVIDISNAAEATIRGVEFEGESHFPYGLRAGGHAAWLDTHYDRYIAVGAGGITANVKGNRLTNVPLWSGLVWIEWARATRAVGSFSLRMESLWQTRVYFTPFNDAVQRQPGYGLVNVSADFAPFRNNWSVGAYMRNLANQDYITGSFSSPLPAVGGRPGESRQAGIRFAVRR